ncbi:MAG: HDOD domain-containing protein [Desulfovibrio sp.]
MAEENELVKILFVDDEPNVLSSIRRMLFPIRKEWQMQFADSGAKALELMEKTRFDVLVTDIRMPEMSGAELLGIVREKHPHTIRIALSGQVDLNDVIKSIRAVHQYIAKPCSSDELIARINGALQSKRVLSDEKMQSLISEIETLPVVPEVFTAIENELNAEEPSIEVIADLISMDVGLVAKLLKLINSPYFGLNSEVKTVFQAIMMLGIDCIRTLLLTTHLFSMYKSDALPQMSLKMLWEHCFRVSNIARLIAEYEGFPKNEIIKIRMAALLHDVGKLVLTTDFSEQYKDVLKLVEADKGTIFECERIVFGTTHAEVGAYLMGLWGISGDIVHGIGYHHLHDQYDMDIALIVCVANVIDHKCVVIHPEYIQGNLRSDLSSKIPSEKIAEWAEHVSNNWEWASTFKALDADMVNAFRRSS